MLSDDYTIWRKFIHGANLRLDEYKNLCNAIINKKYSSIMLAMIIARIYYRPLNANEIYKVVQAFVETGSTLEFRGKYIVDKHSIGGVPGNKVSLIVVPIVAAAGLKIPKTSTKSITTIGTAERMSIFAPVDLTADEIIEVVEKTNGCIASCDKLNLAPVDDILLNIQSEIQLNPASLMIASILAKKKAMGIRYLVLDIPQGRGTKVKTMKEAIALANKFLIVANRLGLMLRCAITYGDQPVGHTVGVALEAREALETLEGGRPSTSLIEKSTGLAGILLEMSGITENGQNLARSLLESGKALKKFREIIESQGGNPNVKADDIPVGPYTAEVYAQVDGYITQIDNQCIVEIARRAGAPHDVGAGVVIPYKGGRYVRRGDTILRIYSSNEARLDDALHFAEENAPIIIEGALRKVVSLH
ncbi:MAG: thymidine phosphorylase [Crenarchaeota archaeon]|nr:thymidine phosphorylase [Thermoproteota archaeon]MCR8454716.1 thymidine phosphorylase [Thermoproteota archaeon]MCR8501292.1 thymidine phosphorylase [Thermoproteota archaeon]